MATRARLFSTGVGGAGGGNAATVASLLPYLTTANVAELAPNVYFSNARVFANLQLASLNDLLDVTYYANISGINYDTRANGFGLFWDGFVWRPANASQQLTAFTTDNLREGNINLYYTNSRARAAYTPGDATIIIDSVAGTIKANVNYFSSAAGNTTDGLPEGLQNLYYTNFRAHANLKNASIFDLLDVNRANGEPFPSAGYTLVSNGVEFLPGIATTALADHANSATEANVVLSIGNFVTANLTEFGNLYFTNERVYSNVANMSLDVLRDVWTPSNLKVTGYVLTWDGNQWMPQNVANIGNVGSSASAYFSERSALANVALFANVASNAYYANVAGRANFATLANIANVSTWASYAEVANTVLNVSFAANAFQVQNLNNFTTDDLRQGNVNFYYTDQKVLANVSSMYLDTLYNVSVSNAQLNEVLVYDGTNWIPGSSIGSAGFAQNAAFANVANTVISLAGHTTDEIIEGTNLYYTTTRLSQDIQAAILNKDIEVDDLIVNGDLTVQGNDVLLNVANVRTQAKTIVLNRGGSGGSGSEGAGLYIEGANVSLRYGETNNGLGLFGNLTVAGDILPAISGRFNLGGPGKLWRGIYIGAQTIYLGNTAISESETGSGLSVKDQYGNEAAISLSNISGTQYVTINRILGNVTPETEFNGYIGGNVNQFVSGKTGNIYFGVLKDGDFNKFAGMRVVETYDNSPNLRSDLYFYTDREGVANSTLSLGILGTGNLEYRGNLITINNIRVIDNRGNFVGNTFLGTRDVDITHGGTGANTTQDARRNLFGDMTGGLVAKIFASNTLTPVSIVGGTGVTVTDGDAQAGAPTISIGQPVATTDSVTFKNVSVTANLTVYGDVTTFGANNLRVSDNMIYINHGANSAANPDTGIVWAFNPDGAEPYQHGGLFRDASDNNTIKFFQGYTLEPDANIFIDTSDASFTLANIQVNEVRGNVVGTVSSLSNHTTDALAEGGTNRYYTNARVVQTVTPLLTTANVVELDNLYFTNARVITALTSFLTTANVRETSGNLYFTNARVLDALVTSNVQVNNLTVSGDLVVQGNTVTLNTAVLTVEDKSITLANGAINAAAADGSGIHIAGANANLTYLSSGDKFELTKNLSVLGNINLTGLFTSENFSANNITANTLSVSGNVSFGTGTGGTLAGLAYAYATNVVANLVTTDVLIANVIRPTRITGNLVVDNKIYANGLILQNIDVTDTVISGNITGGGGSTFNTVTANTITVGALNVTSNIITLLSGVTGDSVSNASLSVNRGTNADVALRWEEVIDRWQFTNDGNVYYNIPIPAEYDNVTYSLSAETSNVTYGANLKLTGTKSNGNIIIQDQIAFKGTGLVRISRQDDDTIVVDAGIAPVTATPVSSTPVEVTRFSIGTYRTAEFIYTVNVVGYINPIYANLFNSGKVLMLHDNQSVIFTQYAMLLTGTGEELVTFTANINNGNVILYATATDSNQITVRLSGTTYTEI